MRRYLYPQISRSGLVAILTTSLLGAVLAGIYGILHDQVTYHISPEYFTRFKFLQFRFADLALGDRVFAGTVGFLATCWVGAFLGWVFGRRFYLGHLSRTSLGKIRNSFIIVLVSGLVFACGGYVYGCMDVGETSGSIANAAILLEVVDRTSFIRAAYVHNASYVGGLVGLVTALFLVKPEMSDPGQTY